MAWNGKDLEVIQAARTNNCVFSKRRKTYVFAAFSSTGNRESFKTALSQLTGIQYEDWELDSDSLYVVRVTPT
jgi:hypothetical protein